MTASFDKASDGPIDVGRETGGFDLAILGAGISGLALAHQAARAGLSTVVLEKASRPGGCIHTVRTADGYWFELGAHTAYNSYGSLLDIIEATGMRDRLQRRSKAPFRLWVDGQVRSVASQLAMGELLASAWRAFTTKKSGRTVEEYYGRLVGKGNWKRVFSPLISAVPSQPADGFPAEMIFKRRPRRKDYPRSFTLMGGLSALVEGICADPRIALRTNAEVRAAERTGSHFVIETADGTRTRARRLAAALPCAAAAQLLVGVAPEVAELLGRITFAEVVSTGVVAAKQDVRFPRLAGLVPLADGFLSLVTRDVVEDERLRGFAFHFRPGLSLEQRLERISAVLRVPRSAFLHVAEHVARLPSPARGHDAIVAALDAALRSPAGRGLYVTGNFLSGLALEDCGLRSRAELDRLLADRQRE